MIGKIPGQDLKEIHQKWVTPGEWCFFPALKLEDIDHDENYTEVIPRDFVY